MNAKDYIDDENYRMAIIELSIALERAIKVHLTKILKQKGVDNFDKLFKDQGLSSVIRFILPLLANKHKISAELLQNLSELITERNNILHQSKYEVKWDPKYFESVVKLLDMLIPRYLTIKRKRLS